MKLDNETYVLVMPSMKHKQAAIEYISEFARVGESIDGTGLEADIGESFDAYGEWISRFYSSDEGAADGKVGGSFTYFFMDENERRLIGTVNIRQGNKIEEEFGNMGYAIRPLLRGQGLGKQLVESAVAMCEFMGLGVLTAVINPENYPSKRILESCGFLAKSILSNGNVMYRRGESNA